MQQMQISRALYQLTTTSQNILQLFLQTWTPHYETKVREKGDKDPPQQFSWIQLRSTCSALEQLMNQAPWKF